MQSSIAALAIIFFGSWSTVASVSLRATHTRQLAGVQLPDPKCHTGVLSHDNTNGTACCAHYCGECSDYPTCQSVNGQDSGNACCKSKVLSMQCGKGAPANTCLKTCSVSVPPCIMDIKVPEPVKSARHAGTDCNEAVADWRAKAAAATKSGEEAAAPTVAKFEEAAADAAEKEAATKAEIKEDAAAKAEEKAKSTGIWTVTVKNTKYKRSKEIIVSFCGHGGDKFNIEMKSTAFCRGDSPKKNVKKEFQDPANKGQFLANQDGDKVGRSAAFFCENQGPVEILQESFHAEDCKPEVRDWGETDFLPEDKKA